MSHAAGYVKLAQAVQWKAEGKQVELKWGAGPWEMFPQDLTHAGATEVLRGNDELEFRIKPHTVKIGNREVEAPVLEPVEGQTVWYWNTQEGCTSHVTYGLAFAASAKEGEFFASESAATEAYAAFLALMRGEA